MVLGSSLSSELLGTLDLSSGTTERSSGTPEGKNGTPKGENGAPDREKGTPDRSSGILYKIKGNCKFLFVLISFGHPLAYQLRDISHPAVSVFHKGLFT